MINFVQLTISYNQLTFSIILLLLPGTCWQQFFFLVSIVVFLFKDILVLLGSSVAREHCSFILVHTSGKHCKYCYRKVTCAKEPGYLFNTGQCPPKVSAFTLCFDHSSVVTCRKYHNCSALQAYSTAWKKDEFR